MPCTTGLNIISVSLDQTQVPLIQSGSLQVTVFNVQNPITKAEYGTGNFQIKTFSEGGIPIDTNVNFGSVGIADPYIAHRKNPYFFLKLSVCFFSSNKRCNHQCFRSN